MSELLHILVIDDDPEMRQLFAEYLLAEGHQVILAESAEEGLSQLPFYTFDVAFLDHNLPGMEGLVLGEYLQKNNPEMAISLVTGDCSDRLKRLCSQADIGYIEKPFEWSELSVVIEAQRVAALRRKKIPIDGRYAFEVDLSAVVSDLSGAFDMPSMPQRIQDKLVRKIRESLDRMALQRQLSEHDRSLAYSGLMSALVLNLRLPKERDGLTLYERYDQLVEQAGGRREFDRLKSS